MPDVSGASHGVMGGSRTKRTLAVNLASRDSSFCRIRQFALFQAMRGPYSFTPEAQALGKGTAPVPDP